MINRERVHVIHGGHKGTEAEFGVAAGKRLRPAVEDCVTQIELVDEPPQLLLVGEEEWFP